MQTRYQNRYRRRMLNTERWLYSLKFECLEARRVLAATLAVTNGDVTITGTQDRDVISVSSDVVDPCSKIVVDQETYDIGSYDSLTIELLSGNDVLYNSLECPSVTVLIRGGAGEDRIYGGPGPQTIEGGDGGDQLYGEQGVDTIYGGEGRDFLHGDQDSDMLYGEAGNDCIYGGTGADMIFGGPGNDCVFTMRNFDLPRDGAPDTVDLGEGDDSISWQVGDAFVSIVGGSGYDRLTIQAIEGDVVTALDLLGPSSEGDESNPGFDVTMDSVMSPAFGFERLSIFLDDTSIDDNEAAPDQNVTIKNLVGVSRMDIFTDSGNDTVEVWPADSNTGVNSVAVKSGPGEDRVGVHIPKMSGDRMSIDLRGESGNDVFSLFAAPTDGDPVEVSFAGGSGDDELIVEGTLGSDRLFVTQLDRDPNSPDPESADKILPGEYSPALEAAADSSDIAGLRLTDGFLVHANQARVFVDMYGGIPDENWPERASEKLTINGDTGSDTIHGRLDMLDDGIVLEALTVNGGDELGGDGSHSSGDSIDMAGISTSILAGTLTINGNAGNDELRARGESDFIDGGAGRDACEDAVSIINCEPLTVVTNTKDSGPGSLRTAIQTANSIPGPNTIQFDIPADDPGFDGQFFSISLLSELPDLDDMMGGTVINAAALANTNPLGPEVLLTGSAQHGFRIRSNENEIRGFAINGLGGDGIEILQGNSNVIAGNYIGVAPDGTRAAGNAFDGIGILDGENNVIGGLAAGDRNVISGNGLHGIAIVGPLSQGNRVYGNFVGVDASGNQAMANSANGILIEAGASNNLIGTAGQGASQWSERNVISGNGESGIRLAGTTTQGNIVAGNVIGMGLEETAIVGNAFDGIRITDGAQSNPIGGMAGADISHSNLIAANGFVGIRVSGDTTEASLGSNIVGLDRTRSRDLDNAFGSLLVEAGHATVSGETFVGQILEVGDTGKLDINANAQVIMQRTTRNDGDMSVRGANAELETRTLVSAGTTVVEDGAVLRGSHLNFGDVSKPMSGERLRVAGGAARVLASDMLVFLAGVSRIGANASVRVGEFGTDGITIIRPGAELILASDNSDLSDVDESVLALLATDQLQVLTDGKLTGSGRIEPSRTFAVDVALSGSIELARSERAGSGYEDYRSAIHIDGSISADTTSGVSIELSKGHELEPTGVRHSAGITVEHVVQLPQTVTVTFADPSGELPEIGDRFIVFAANKLEGRVDKIELPILEGVTDRFAAFNYRHDVPRLGVSVEVLEIIIQATPLRVNGPTPYLVDDVGIPSNPRENLVLIAHGTNATGDDFPAELAGLVNDRLNDNTVDNWDVTTLDWRFFAGGAFDEHDNRPFAGWNGFDPFMSASNGIDIGESLVQWMQTVGLAYEKVQLVSHSSGSWLVNAISDRLPAANEVQLTLFDSFAPPANPIAPFEIFRQGTKRPSLGESADFSEQYFDRGWGGDVLGYTQEILKHAVNIETSFLHTPILNPIASHAFPYEWYIRTAMPPTQDFTSGGFGFPLSQEALGVIPKHPADGPFARGNHLVLYPDGDSAEVIFDAERVDAVFLARSNHNVWQCRDQSRWNRYLIDPVARDPDRAP